ncbi:MAG: EF-P lysine aminoacylase GenX [Desulfofustis sp.]|nr:EF-P lysine aminoacylase GenX [Desulfofustis sp.]
MLTVEGLHLRAALFRSIRTFFFERGFLEVDTPIRSPVLLPERHISPIACDGWFLQPSPEQCMKRLLARGCRTIFQICPCFRAGERGRRHLTEFTMLEWYRLDSDYRDLMSDCEALVNFVLDDLAGSDHFRQVIGRSCFGTGDAAAPWERLTVGEAFARHCPETVDQAMATNRFDELLVEHIEPHLGLRGPVFLTDYPAACASLARLKPSDQAVAERFELYIRGVELANGFSELTDAAQQRARFVEELNYLEEQTGCRRQMPEAFLNDLSAIDTAAGIAFGLDRFLMLLLSVPTIDQAVSFGPDELC